jgi:hypothetical protein
LSVSGLLLFILFLSVITSGCGGGGGGVDTSSSIPLVEGVFIDSAVQGLEYETPTRNGITDAEGTFMYHEGDTIRFYIGDIMLGEAVASSMMTPIDLVDGATDETHPAVINMARFLQTIDEDMNPENGITITGAMSNAMIGHMIDFNMDPDSFTYDPDVMMVMSAINEVAPYRHMRTLVSADDAVTQFSSYMNNMTAMMTEGSITTAGQTDGQMMSSGSGM